MKQIFCKTEKCLACRSCQLACATAHSKSKNLERAIQEQPLSKYRIHVEVIDEDGNLSRSRVIAIQCRHCDEPYCVQACISGALYKDAQTENILINAEKCVACWSCVMVCPFGVIARHEGLQQAIKCDNCPDREVPACVEACPTSALVYCEKEEIKRNHL